METFLQDLRYALRMMRKTPGFTLVAVLALALGIGANTAMFSLVDGFLLQRLPVKDPGSLVWLGENSQQVPGMSISVPDLEDWQAQNHVFQGIAGMNSDDLTLTGHGRPQQLSALQVTGNYFSVLGVKPALGRAFVPDEDHAGAAPVALLSYQTWTERFGADRGIVGHTVDLDGKPCTIIGVLPASFNFNLGTDVYVPLLQRLDPETQHARGHHPGIYAIARLRPGVTLEAARTGLLTVAQRLQRQYPESNAGVGIDIQPIREYLAGDVRPTLLILMGAVGFVLLIACANLAGLLLARSLLRQKEIAIRFSLGAARGRVIRQLLTESVVLAVIGGAAGLLLADWGLRALLAMLPQHLPLANQVNLNGSVLAFTLAVAVLTGVLFGLAPALQGTRSDLNQILRDGGRQATGVSHHRLNHALVIGEVALALVLLVGAGLLLRSFYQLQKVSPGFDPHGVVTADVALPSTRYSTPEQQRAFFHAVLQRLRTQPGIQSAGAITPIPFGEGGWQTSFALEGTAKPAPGQEPETDIGMVSPGYFRTMHVPLLRGRLFDDHDDAQSAGVAIVDQSFAAKYWPGKDPIGQHIKVNTSDFADKDKPVLTVVGVVGHTMNYGLDGTHRIETYIPFLQSPHSGMTLVARTPMAHSERLGAEITAAVQTVDPDQPVSHIRTMDDRVDQSLSTRRLALYLLSVFAALALLLAAIGLYGVISYSVTQRTHEIGIRMALGADQGSVLGMVLKQGMTLAVVGVAIGLVVGFLLSQTMSSLLYGVRGYDPITYAVLSATLLAVACFSAWLPARRATRVDPMIALRGE